MMQPEDVRAALVTIARTEQAVRRTVLRWTVAPTLVTWGIVWLVGYLGTLFFARTALTYLWAGLVALGFAVTFGLQVFYERRVRSPIGRRIDLSWLVASGYLALWSSLLFPRDPHIASFVLVTGIMAGYVLIGIWLTRLMLVLGLFVTAVATIGFLLGPAAFALLVGLLGGGALIAGGLWLWWSGRDDAR